MSWKDPEINPRHSGNYDYTTETVLVKFIHPTLGEMYSTGYKDWDGDEMVWSLNSRWTKNYEEIVGWKYIEDE